jgi:hypothetical protein
MELDSEEFKTLLAETFTEWKRDANTAPFSGQNLEGAPAVGCSDGHRANLGAREHS